MGYDDLITLDIFQHSMPKFYIKILRVGLFFIPPMFSFSWQWQPTHSGSKDMPLIIRNGKCRIWTVCSPSNPLPAFHNIKGSDKFILELELERIPFILLCFISRGHSCQILLHKPMHVDLWMWRHTECVIMGLLPSWALSHTVGGTRNGIIQSYPFDQLNILDVHLVSIPLHLLGRRYSTYYIVPCYLVIWSND